MDWKELIADLQQHPTEEKAAELDAQGFLAAPGEDEAAYAERLKTEALKISRFREQLQREKVLEPYDGNAGTTRWR